MEDKIFVTKTSMPPYEEFIQAIKPLWESHWLTNMGEFHNRLEAELRDYLKLDNISLFVNGHMALEMVIKAMDFPKDGEVITTPFTFISTTHAIVRNGLTPVFCDIKKSDYTIDEKQIESLITDKTVAILPVHVYGNICNVDAIEAIASKYNLKVIYDAAHAFGIETEGRGIGTYGDASIFSFHATKVFNTIEGGAVSFKDEALAKKLFSLKNFGIENEEVVSAVGANAKLHEISAIMGLCNLNHIEEEIAKRKICCEKYTEFLREIKGIKINQKNECIKNNYGYFPILIDENVYGHTRDDLYDYFRANNIHARKYFYPLTADQICFDGKYKESLIENARYISDRILTLPLYADLDIKDVERICLHIKNLGMGK